MTLGEKLKNVRIENDLSMSELCNRLNKKYNLSISKSMVSRWENNKAEPVNTFLAAYAKEFDLDMNYLLGINEEKEKLITSLPDDYFTTPEDAINFLLNQKVIMAYTGVDIDTLSDDEKIQFANRLLDYTKLLGYDYKND